MASYIDTLGEDRDRIRRALKGLIEEQETRIRELSETLSEYGTLLDRHVLRTMIFRGAFGSGGAETMLAETETEVASKPVTEAAKQLERETNILKLYQEALARIESGGSLEDLGKIPAVNVA